MHRIFDQKEKKWIKDNVYLAPNDDLFISKKSFLSFFGAAKLSLIPEHRYIYQKDIGLKDKNNRLVFEGDICRAKDGEFIGVVTYVTEHAAYYLLDDVHSTFYPIGVEYMRMIEVIGNVLENQDLLKTTDTEGGQNAST